MKKFLTLVSAIALVFTSCSKDDNPAEEQSTSTGPLLTKIIDTFEDGSTYTTEYEYSANKLVKATDSDGEYQLFTYTGNLITKIEYFLSDNTLDQVETHTYNSNDEFISFVRVFPSNLNLGKKETYTYNSNGTITVKYYSGDYNSQTVLGDTATITFLNGEISQIALLSGNIDDYTYDNKNNPFKNVLGFNKISFKDGLAEGVLKNVASMESSVIGGSYLNTYTYNSNDYPLTEVSASNQETISSAYFYN